MRSRSLCVVAFSFARDLQWSFRAISATNTLHDRALAKTLRTNLRFFDTNPVGRILNRFSFDVDGVERQMAMAFEQMIFAAAHALFTMGVIVALSPWTLLVLAPSLWGFLRLQNPTSSSPIFSIGP